MTGLVRADIGWEHPDDPGEPSTGVRRLSISDREAELLAEYSAGKFVVEIGTGLGVSTRALASTAKFVVTIDPDPWVHQNIAPDLDALGNVACVTSRPIAGVWAENGIWTGHGQRRADLIFIDGDHTTHVVAEDIRWAYENVAPGGKIILHDANYDNVRLALPDAIELIATEHGLAVIST